ncbi:unnamed protein product [Colias eurytheme]|nr:unnamed protein product [Colias eurytheme]
MEFEEPKSKKQYKCAHVGCTAEFDRPHRLTQHHLTHFNYKPFTCVEDGCGKSYTSKSHLERHINSTHRSYNADVLYTCPKCLKQYANRQNLKRHYKIQHLDGTKPFACEQCPLSFKHKHQLSTHMYHHTGIKAFNCPMCPKQFVTITEQKKHIRNHKVFTCEHCNQQFTRWTDVLHHKQTNHQSEEYICDDCGKTFNRRQHIVRHVKLHANSRENTLYFCPFENCFRHYSRNSNLKQHIQVKHEGMTFNCHLCDAKLTTMAKLNEHIERHNRPAMYKPPKTLVTGRKKRKDAYVPRTNTALKLAGLHCSFEQNPYMAQGGTVEPNLENGGVNQLCNIGIQHENPVII